MAKAGIDTTRLQRLARAYTESATFFAALDFELFTHVEGGVGSVAELAGAMDVLELDAERLVTACLAMGLLEWRDGRLVNAPDAARFLVKGEARYAEPWMTFTRPGVGDWFRLSEIMAAKREPTVLGMYADLTVEQARAYHSATYSIGMGAGRLFARTVDLAGRKKLLDLGGGSGAYSINAVQSYPGLEAVVLDLPPVVEVTKEYLAENGVSDRVSTLAADFTADDFPAADVVVMASNLPIYDEAVVAQVVAKAFAALEPGGEMHLVGEMVTDDRTGPLDAAMWGLAEALSGGAGKAHTIGQCRGYFEAAGFEEVGDEVFVAGTLQRVFGRKVG
ncbi:MAG TPA: methyltransferase [Alphaproteobacteria bacterium]|jgi:predicted nicotinamide N-methyase|nr:methyltransferase [Alphaproteobacteria bacterium]MDP6270063.1 methyltransferase [Alphaproteobacteria bacterium]MDP7429568.1 methyltransferase [Alphaproteobacteria bacterium]HJM50595.1 methyltransferase [Alphaproteobacteria bacterium]